MLKGIGIMRKEFCVLAGIVALSLLALIAMYHCFGPPPDNTWLPVGPDLWMRAGDGKLSPTPNYFDKMPN